MDHHELLLTLLDRGVKLTVNDDSLSFQAPKGALTADLKESLVAQKEDVMALIGPNHTLRPCSYAQERLYFLAQFEPDNAAYNIPTVLRLQGELDKDILEESFNVIVSRHETLRTTFSQIGAQPVQHIAREQPLTISFHDYLHLPLTEQTAVTQQQILQTADTPFDLHHGPLLRVDLIRLRPEEHLLLLTFHHIVADGWSLGVLLRELTTLYTHLGAGQPNPLPPLPLQYADYARWQRAWLADGVLEKQLAYWQNHLDGANFALDLLTDHARPAAAVISGVAAGPGRRRPG